MTMRRSLSTVFLLSAVMAGCSGGDDTPSTPTAPTPPPTPTVSVTAVAVAGAASLAAKDATAQFTAMATLSNGTTEDRTGTATWLSENPAVATVSPQGLVRAVGNGSVAIVASVGEIRGNRTLAVAIPNRAPDPPAGQRLPLPDVEGFVRAAAAARPDLMAQQCPNGRKYENNPWLDYMVDRLRTLDTRWGYNGKPVKSPADNGGFPVIAAGDEIAYHFSAGPDQGSPDVYLIDILEQHCGNPRVTWRVFTGEEPGRWTGAGRF